MNINRMVVTYGGTVNVGDYSNVKLEVTLEMGVDHGEDADLHYQDLLAKARAAYIAEVSDLALNNYSALSYLRAIAPGEAAVIAERRKEATKADKS